MSKKRLVITAIVLALVLAIGGILAYFTDVQTKSNKFKMGDVKILVEEPSWPGNPDNPGDPEKEVPIVPNQEVPKDPQITNKGEGEIYAFAEVTIPRESVKVGDSTTAAMTELFLLLHNDATTNTSVSGINSGWVEIESARTTNADGSITHVYAYGTATKLTKLVKNAKTPAVFDSVKFVDVKEENYSNAGVQGKTYEVKVSGYGIQVDGLNSENPATVWPLVK